MTKSNSLSLLIKKKTPDLTLSHRIAEERPAQPTMNVSCSVFEFNVIYFPASLYSIVSHWCVVAVQANCWLHQLAVLDLSGTGRYRTRPQWDTPPRPVPQPGCSALPPASVGHPAPSCPATRLLGSPSWTYVLWDKVKWIKYLAFRIE